jgi:ATP-binding cassette subfamily F protein uup
VVSHDRYFLNAMVDHLFVFEGNGSIKDFPGTYAEYREWMEKNKKTVSHAPEKNQIASGQTKNNQKLSFKEKRELDLLGSEIAHLESEKAALTKKMSEGDAGHEQIYTWAERLREIEQFLEEKTTRWFVLSEKEAQG